MKEYGSFEPKGELRTKIEAFLASDGSSVVEPRLASTVMLLSRVANSETPLVFMMKRASTMEFAPDAVAFPGGGVSSGDYFRPSGWRGPSLQAWAGSLCRDEETSCAVLVAAARELFEECGVLLACDSTGEMLAKGKLDELQPYREDLSRHRICFAEFLERFDLSFRSDLLRVRSNIVTPDFSPRRYDTFFFSAMLPIGQSPDGMTSESVKSTWADPGEVIREAQRGELQLLYPTKYNLELIIDSNVGAEESGTDEIIETIRPHAFFDEAGVLKVGLR